MENLNQDLPLLESSTAKGYNRKHLKTAMTRPSAAAHSGSTGQGFSASSHSRTKNRPYSKGKHPYDVQPFKRNSRENHRSNLKSGMD